MSQLLNRIKKWRSVTAIFVIGGVCIVASWIIQDKSWPSGMLIEIGATFLLFGPLFIIQKRTERHLERVREVQTTIQEHQEKATEEISALSSELAQAKDEFRCLVFGASP